MKVEDITKYKDSLYSSLSRDLDAFEKNFILITSGVLAFSITFIKDIVKIDEAVYILILFLGWLLILIAIGLMMFAFLSSVNGSNKLWKISDDFLTEKNKFNAEDTFTSDEDLEIKTQINVAFFTIKENLKRQRAWAIACFLVGFSLFSIFVCANLYRENHPKRETKVMESNVIRIGDTSSLKKDTLIIYQK